jgi:hypothetical protein
MKKNKKLTSTALLGIALLGCIADVCAAPADNFSLQVGAESFRWREFDAGQRLLEEKGARLRLGVGWNNFQRTDDGVLYGVDAALHLGRVTYDGQACLVADPSQCWSSASDTTYSGVELAGLGGIRFARGFEFLGGVGLDMWLRDIRSTVDAAGHSVSSAREEYLIFNSKVGAGYFHRMPTWSTHFQAGVKYPFYAYEYAFQNSFDDLTLSPKGRASGFATLRVDFAPQSRNPVGLIFYYDSYRFAPSDIEQQTINGVAYVSGGNTYYAWQPESRQDVYGVQLAVQFR